MKRGILRQRLLFVSHLQTATFCLYENTWHVSGEKASLRTGKLPAKQDGRRMGDLREGIIHLKEIQLAYKRTSLSQTACNFEIKPQQCQTLAVVEATAAGNVLTCEKSLFSLQGGL